MRTLALTASLFACAASVHAQDAQEGSETTEARALFEAGRTAFEAGRFESALESFERAYELSHRPALLYNMGSAAERLRRDELAIRYYDQYLAELPNAENRTFVEARLQFLRNDRASDDTPDSDTPDSRSSDRPSGGGVEQEWWFWTLIAVVVIGAGVGIGVGVAFSDPGTLQPAAGNFGSDGVAMALVRF